MYRTSKGFPQSPQKKMMTSHEVELRHDLLTAGMLDMADGLSHFSKT